MLRTQTDARTISQPQPAALGLLGWNLQPLLSPDPLDTLVVDDPTRRCPHELRDLTIAVATVLAGEFDDVGGQPIFVVASLRRLALRRAMLSERRAGATLGDLEFAPDVLDNCTSARGA